MNKSTNLEKCTKHELIQEIYTLRNKLKFVEKKFNVWIHFNVEGQEDEVCEVVQLAFEAAKKTIERSSVFCEDFAWGLDEPD